MIETAAKRLEINITEIAYGRMLEEFEKYGHRPSGDMLNALHELIQTLTSMADGEASPYYYLCSVDPGVGKSTAIIQWLKTYLEYLDIYNDIGVLIGLERYDEILRFIQDSGIKEGDYAVFVTESNNDLNGLGLTSKNGDKARVLFTTKAQIRLRSRDKSFSMTPQFFFKGKERAVKIWDESLLLGRKLTLDRTEIGGLLTTLNKENLNLYEQIENIFIELKQCKDGDVYPIPSFDIEMVQ